ncbi:unnamed protein product [Orchesella dallaii]|uniref:Uncharacterized protein n=1 Tax=Orchesella dallaii TaxID=48710 RepID=A0ABP1R7F8_9HEXA
MADDVHEFMTNNAPEELHNEECLIHLTIYELQLPNTDLSSGLKKYFPQDLVPLHEPTILSKYLEQPLNDDENYKRVREDSEAVTNENQTAFLFPPRVHNFPCVAQIYIFPEAFILLSNTVDSLYFVREGHGTVIFPKVTNFSSRWSLDSTNAPTLLKRGVFEILITDEPDMLQELWVSTIDSYDKGVRYATVANHFTELIIRLSLQTYELREVSLVYNDIYDYKLVSKFINDWLNISNIQESIELKLNEISHNTKMDWLGGPKHLSYIAFQKIALNMVAATKDYFLCTGFRDFQTWMSSDLMLFHVAFPNSNMTFSANTTDRTTMVGEIEFEDLATPYMAIEETGFKFITCGGGVRGTMSLIGYVSAFDNWIWAWFAIFVIATSTTVVLSSGFLAADIRMFERISTLDYIFMPLDTVLEQGSSLHVSGNEVYCISAAWVLVGVVLSNAYKGQNITDLSSPIPPIKPTMFADLVEMNFTIYTYPADEEYIDVDVILEPIVNLFLRRNATISSTGGYNKRPNILSKFIVEAGSVNDIVQKYMRIHEKVVNFTSIELFNSSRYTSYVRYIEKIKSCDKTAFMGWSDEIENNRLHLDDILFNAGRQSDKDFISTSEETLFQMTKGWTLRDVVIVTTDISTRMSILVESGIGQQWKRIEKRVKNLQLLFKTHGRSRPLLALTLNDNISVVFYVHCGLLLMACIIFMLEKCFGYLFMNIITMFIKTI